MSSHEGFLVVNKPTGITSFDVIRKMRSLFSCKKIGHAGTLDPEAEGVLILAFGAATRLIPFLAAEPKVYRFEVQFGKETDTLDRAGKVVHDGGILPGKSEIAALLPSFLGMQDQTPPVFSAIKVHGERAYTLARKGTATVLAPRKITIHSFDLSDYDPATGRAWCEVSCSGGTYVRSLARDIALRLSTWGFAQAITRRACGTFSLANAIPLVDITSETPSIPIREALDGIPSFEGDEQMLSAISFGRSFSFTSEVKETGDYIMILRGERFVALARKCGEHCYHPEIVSQWMN